MFFGDTVPIAGYTTKMTLAWVVSVFLGFVVCVSLSPVASHADLFFLHRLNLLKTVTIFWLLIKSSLSVFVSFVCSSESCTEQI